MLAIFVAIEAWHVTNWPIVSNLVDALFLLWHSVLFSFTYWVGWTFLGMGGVFD